jgi:hypothetical protein
MSYIVVLMSFQTIYFINYEVWTDVLHVYGMEMARRADATAHTLLTRGFTF